MELWHVACRWNTVETCLARRHITARSTVVLLRRSFSRRSRRSRSSDRRAPPSTRRRSRRPCPTSSTAAAAAAAAIRGSATTPATSLFKPTSSRPTSRRRTPPLPSRSPPPPGCSAIITVPDRCPSELRASSRCSSRSSTSPCTGRRSTLPESIRLARLRPATSLYITSPPPTSTSRKHITPCSRYRPGPKPSHKTHCGNNTVAAFFWKPHNKCLE